MVRGSEMRRAIEFPFELANAVSQEEGKDSQEVWICISVYVPEIVKAFRVHAWLHFGIPLG